MACNFFEAELVDVAGAAKPFEAPEDDDAD